MRIAKRARNLTDREPLYTNAGNQNFQTGYYPGYVDQRGRRFYNASMKYSVAGAD